MSFKVLARVLNEKGVATPRNVKGWRGSSVQVIIGQLACAGIYYSNRGKDFDSLLSFYTIAQLEAAVEEHGWVRVPGYPAIIDESTWESTQSTRLSYARKNKGRPTVPGSCRWLGAASVAERRPPAATRKAEGTNIAVQSMTFLASANAPVSRYTQRS